MRLRAAARVLDHLLRADLRAAATALGRDLDGFGLDYVALTLHEPVATVDAAERWRDAGGTHFSAVSMGAGRDSIDAHVDYFAAVAERLGSR